MMTADDPSTGKPGNRPSAPGPSFLSGPFNAQAGQTSELEIKFLAARNDSALFGLVVTYFQERGWLRYINDEYYLLTRQFDTPGLDLARGSGTTLRTRASSSPRTPDLVRDSDICIKSGQTEDESGAIRRAEYQARIADFRQPDFGPLRERYPAEEYPELHEILSPVSPESLHEYFRIESLHRRCVIELPEEETGLYDERFVAEIVCDDCSFLCRDDQGSPAILRRDQEFECELLLEPDDYDRHPMAKRTHSTPLAPDQASRGMTILKRHILAAAAGMLVPHQVSKAERGQEALLQLACLPGLRP